MDKQDMLTALNAPEKVQRLMALRGLMTMIKSGEIDPPVKTKFVNNHIHTTYSFSPYSPSAAVFMAYMAGLETSGIMDHDSVGGAAEFVEAGSIVGMPVTNGCEMRVHMTGTPVEGRRINSPDQKNLMYVALHGIPRNRLGDVEAFLVPYRAARNLRNRAMIDKLNDLLASYDIFVDFDRDVVPTSMFREGGTITERHLMFAAAHKMIERFGQGEKLVSFLEKDMGMTLSDKIRGYLLDEKNPYYDYDLLGALKSDFLGKIYIPSTDECPHVTEFVALAKKVGGIAAYPYLGDVGNSVTGDKKAQKFEDDYLDLMLKTVSDLGFDAVTYMPSRNTPEQLDRLIKMCEDYNFFQISGEDINTPRQSFICKALENPAYAHLYTSTYALIGHELATTEDQSMSMFADKAKSSYLKITQRVDQYSVYAKHRL